MRARFFAPLRMTTPVGSFSDFDRRTNHMSTSPRLGFTMSGFQDVEYREPLVGASIAVRQNSLIALNLKNCAGDFAPLTLAELRQLLDDFGFAHVTSLLVDH